MIPLLRVLIAAAVVVAAALWFAERPGVVRFDWLGWRVETSMPVLVLLTLILSAVLSLLWRSWDGLRGGLHSLARGRRDRRREKGLQALTQGLVAAAAGEGNRAATLARKARTGLGDGAVHHLLTAQAAQVAGDTAGAEKAFATLAGTPETAFLGVRGLLTQALKRGDRGAALPLAERALALRPDSPWAASTLFDLQVRVGQWAAARQTLEQGLRHGAFQDGPGLRAVLLHEQAVAAAAEGNDLEARRLWQKAHDEDHSLVPAALALARGLALEGRERKAAQILAAAFTAAPHPELAAAHDRLFAGEGAMDRYKRMSELVAATPEAEESRLALAGAALEAHLWGEARKVLAPLLVDPVPPRAARLMAAIEESENGDAAAAAGWLRRAAGETPAWTCGDCGARAAAWSAFCGNCGAFAALTWRRPAEATPNTLPAPGSA